ncbi:MAG: ArsR family transcriptional regulator [Salinirussus sp.]
MGEKQWEAENVFDVIGDSLARKLLVILSEERQDVAELTEVFDASEPTIYRRLDTLADYDLIKVHQEVDEDGHHYKTFETTLQRISLEIEDGGYDIDISLRRSLVDQFESFWSDLEQTSPTDSRPDFSDTDHSITEENVSHE